MPLHYPRPCSLAYQTILQPIQEICLIAGIRYVIRLADQEIDRIIWVDFFVYPPPTAITWHVCSQVLENIADPSHIPWAHHNYQGSRDDSVPLNLTSVPGSALNQSGASFYQEDRTMNQFRSGHLHFRPPYTIHYELTVTSNITVAMIPTRPGWSRSIIFGPDRSAKIDTAKAVSPRAKIFYAIPVWMNHILSSRFLDTDLSFLHWQEQERFRRDKEGGSSSYFMPAESDAAVLAVRRWVQTYAHIPQPLPPPIRDRRVLLDHWTQHCDQCQYCSKAADDMKLWRRNACIVLSVSLLLNDFIAARVAAVGCICFLGAVSKLEELMMTGDFEGYKNE